MYKIHSSSVSLVSDAATEPVTVSEAKDHLRVDISDDDTLIGNYIKTARQYVEYYCGQSFISRTYRADIYGFADDIWLPYGPVLSVSSIQYYDTSSPEALQTWASANYRLHNDVIYRGIGVNFPSTGSQPDNVQITYVAGWNADSPQTVPEPVRQVILLMVGSMYEQREVQVFYPGQVLQNPVYKALLSAYRAYR